MPSENQVEPKTRRSSQVRKVVGNSRHSKRFKAGHQQRAASTSSEARRATPASPSASG